MSGEMEKPLVMGKAAKPRCFRKMDIWKLPVDWRSDKKTWMTSQIMEEWLVNGFQWKNENTKPACFLFLDNAT
jgi:hypothetical protein